MVLFPLLRAGVALGVGAVFVSRALGFVENRRRFLFPPRCNCPHMCVIHEGRTTDG